jgi:hypothetical protein
MNGPLLTRSRFRPGSPAARRVRFRAGCGHLLGRLCLLAASMLTGALLGAAQESDSGAPKEFSFFKLITDRNIFDPNRRPPVAHNVEPVRKVVDSFGLYGTMSYDTKGPFAVFSGTHSEYHQVLEKGGSIAGYTVDNIGHDLVQLSAGTNSVELRVGMQMRRSDDGTWSVAEASDYAGMSRAPESGSWGSRRFDRRSDGRGNSRNSGRSSSSGSTDQGGMANAGPGGQAPPEMSPAGASAGEADDPVARLMRRRMQETGGEAPPGDVENPGGEPPPPGPNPDAN